MKRRSLLTKILTRRAHPAQPAPAAPAAEPEPAPTPEPVQQTIHVPSHDETKAVSLPQRIPPSREHTAELTRQANEEARQARVAANCPCTVIYSRCYCKGKR